MFGIENLTVSQKKAYRQRVKYWVEKGLGQKEAESKAAEKLRPQHIRLAVEPKETKAEKEPEPAPRLVPASFGLDETWRRLPISAIVDVVVCLTLTSGSTCILVAASVDILGYGWKGWVQALTLEFGILALAGFRSDSRTRAVGVKMIMLALMGLSLFILHTGVETNRVDATQTTMINDEVLNGLREQRDRVKDLHDNRPKNHTTLRAEDLKRLGNITNDIKYELQRIKSSHTVGVIDLHSDMDLYIRIGLMVLNIICAHRFVVVLGKYM